MGKTVENEDEHFLSRVTLDAREWRGVRELAKSLSDFEPLAKRSRLGPIGTNRLVVLGLAEKGFSKRYDSPGYRLTDLGWKVYKRGRYR